MELKIKNYDFLETDIENTIGFKSQSDERSGKHKASNTMKIGIIGNKMKENLKEIYDFENKSFKEYPPLSDEALLMMGSDALEGVCNIRQIFKGLDWDEEE